MKFHPPRTASLQAERARSTSGPDAVGLTLDTPNPAGGYNNNNYTVLSAVIAGCTGMAYDEYADRAAVHRPAVLRRYAPAR